MTDSFKSIAYNFAAVILSAGKSERFGIPKAYLVYNDSKSFLQQLLYEYHKAGVKHIIVVTNSSLASTMERQLQKAPAELNVKLVINPDPERGRFSSVLTGLGEIGDFGNAFIQNIDNPFTTSDLLRQMMIMVKDGSFVFPEWNGRKGHPVLISKAIINYLKVKGDGYSDFREVLQQFPSLKVHSDNSSILANINTPDDYRKYFHHVVTH